MHAKRPKASGSAALQPLAADAMGEGSNGASVDRETLLSQNVAIVKVGQRSCIVRITTGNDNLYVAGFCKIHLLKGRAQVNGYEVLPEKASRIDSPVWSPAVRLGCQASKGKIYKQASTDAKDMMGKCQSKLGPELSNAFFTDESAILCIEGIADEEQDWLIAAEDHSSFVPTARHYVMKLTFLGSAVFGKKDDITMLGIECFQTPSSWTESVNVLKYRINTTAEPSSSSSSTTTSGKTSKQSNASITQVSVEEELPLCAVICGAKGVGKSSYLRYTINSLISTGARVYVMDCDVGQPEFTMPGLVSLNVLESEVLSPPHLHMQRPVKSFYLGDVISKNEPSTLIEAVRILYDQYSMLRDDYVVDMEAKIIVEKKKEMKRKAACNNPFEILRKSKVETVHSVARSLNKATYLLVNTDGFIRYMGAEILSSIMNVVKPTHIIHVSTEKDRSLPAIDMIRDTNPACNIITLEPGKTSPSAVAAVDLRNLRMVSYFLRRNDFLKARLNGLNELNRSDGSITGISPGTPGEQHADPKSCTTRISIAIRNGAIFDPEGLIAQALLISDVWNVPFWGARLCTTASVPYRYILAALNASLVAVLHDDDDMLLEEESGCGSKGNKASKLGPGMRAGKHTSNAVSKNDSLDAEDESGSREPGPVTEESTARMCAKSAEMMFSQHSFRHPLQSEEPRGSGSAQAEGSATECDSMNGHRRFNLHCGNGIPLVPCQDFAIVRSVDVSKETLHLLVASTSITIGANTNGDHESNSRNARASSSSREIPRTSVSRAARTETASSAGTSATTTGSPILLRGALSLPAMMIYHPGSPLAAYVSGEHAGEGSGAIRPRKSLKRRSQSGAK